MTDNPNPQRADAEGGVWTPVQLSILWNRTLGQAWEPPKPNSPLVLALLKTGYVRRADGRCGFEAFKDSMLAWTEAGKAAMAAPSSQSQTAGKSPGNSSNNPVEEQQ